MSKVFEIVQAMSGQGDSITIPTLYLDFFVDDRQQHLLAAILNQMVLLAGQGNGCFQAEHAALAKSVRAKDGDVVRKAIYKITEHYLTGVVEEELLQVNGKRKKHYRIHQDALITKLFPHVPELPQVTDEGCMGAENHCTPDPEHGSGGRTDNRPFTPSGAAIIDGEKGLWGSAEDLAFSEWFYARMVELNEFAAEFDGERARPEEPDWAVWANAVRLLREKHECNHESMRSMVGRVHRSREWCNKIETVIDLFESWATLAVKL